MGTQQAAIKFLPASMAANHDAADRFKRESRAASLWKDADADLAPLAEAKAEYGKL